MGARKDPGWQRGLSVSADSISMNDEIAPSDIQVRLLPYRMGKNGAAG